MRKTRGDRVLAAGMLCLFAIIVSTASPAAGSSFDCLVEPAQTVELTSPVTGLLDHVLAKRGDRVSKGQVLAMLESHAEQAAADLALFKSRQAGPIYAAANKIDFAKRKFEQRHTLATEELMAIQDRDDAEAEYKLAQSELQVAEENRRIAQIEYQHQSALLELRTMRSPFDGVVAEQLAYPGEVVEPDASKKAVLKLAQLDPLRIHVLLPKRMFGRLEPGLVAEVTPEIPLKSQYRARVKSVDRLLDAASGTFVTILELPNPAGISQMSQSRISRM